MRGSVRLMRLLQNAGLHPPRTLTLAITGQCNLRCGHCLVGAGESGSAAPVPETLLRRVLRDFVALEGQGVCLTGGEPLTHPHWLHLLRFVRTLGIEGVSLQTNGTLWGASAVAAVRDLGFQALSLRVSLDGASAATHDHVRGAGAFAAVMGGLEQLVANGLASSVTLCFTEMRHNLAEFPAVLVLAQDLGVARVVSGTLVAAGRAGSGPLAVSPDPDQYRRLRVQLASDARFRQLYERLGSMAPLEWGREAEPKAEGCTFVAHPYLAAGGMLYPCVFCQAPPAAVGGVWEKGLPAALAAGAPEWGALARASRRRFRSLPECRRCAGRQLCGGGCMGRAWAAAGSYATPDDRCRLRQERYQSVAPS